MIRVILRWLGFLFLLCLPIAYFFVLVAAIIEFNKAEKINNYIESSRKARFFMECVKYEPKYMCDLKWKELE